MILYRTGLPARLAWRLLGLHANPDALPVRVRSAIQTSRTVGLDATALAFDREADARDLINQIEACHISCRLDRIDLPVLDVTSYVVVLEK